jgi:hypothetical protein
LTNNTALWQKLQEKLVEHLDVQQIIPMTNRTLLWHIALKALAKG